MSESGQRVGSTPLRKIALFAGAFYWAYDLIAKQYKWPTLDQVSPFWAGIVLVVAGIFILRYGYLWLKETSRDKPMTPLYVAAGLFVLGFVVLAWWTLNSKAKNGELQEQLTADKSALDVQLAEEKTRYEQQLAAAKANYDSQLVAASEEANGLPRLLAEEQQLRPKILDLNGLIKTASNKLGDANKWFQELNRSTKPVEKRSATAPFVLEELGADVSVAIDYAVETGMEEIKIPRFKPLNLPVTHGIGIDGTFSRNENEPYMRELREHLESYEATVEVVHRHGRQLEEQQQRVSAEIRGEAARLKKDIGR